MNDEQTTDEHDNSELHAMRSGYVNYPLSDLQDVREAPHYAMSVARAVGQLIVTTPRGAHVHRRGSRRPLIVPTVKLRHREFIDGYPLYQDTKSDLCEFFDQLTVRAATATLIGPKCILTAAHAVMPIDVRSRNTYFVPYRTNDHRDFGGRRIGHTLHIPKHAYYRVKRICAIATKDERKLGVDWAVLELEDEPQMITPIPVGKPILPGDPDNRIYTLTHPLGLPLKYSAVAPSKDRNNQATYSRVLSDFGSGSSGAPMLAYNTKTQATTAWGVITGKARFTAQDVHPTSSGKTINPKSGAPVTPQPVTLSTQMRKSDCKDCDDCGC